MVVASLDGFGSQTVRLTVNTKDTVVDLLTGRRLSGGTFTLKLGPGEGTVLFVGSREDYNADRILIQMELAKWK